MKPQRKLVSKPVWQLDVAGTVPASVDAQCIGLADQLAPEEVLRLATGNQLRHLCQRQGFEFARDLEAAQLMAQAPETFRDTPVSTILTPLAASVAAEKRLMWVDAAFKGSVDKQNVLDQITTAMASRNFARTLSEDVISVADELFTNAVFNAPFVDLVTQVNPGVNRHDTHVQFDADKQARLFLAQDATRLVVGCEDPFGSLNLHRYLNKIKDTYVKGPAASMNFGPGGAGLGSYIIFNAGSSLFFGVWPGQTTVLCCVIPLGLSLRKRTQLPKHLHWIQP